MLQLPPSYEQVIKEKTKEQDTTPTPLPRRSLTTTIATQTDTLEQNATNSYSKTPLLLIQQHRSEGLFILKRFREVNLKPQITTLYFGTD